MKDPNKILEEIKKYIKTGIEYIRLKEKIKNIDRYHQGVKETLKTIQRWIEYYEKID